MDIACLGDVLMSVERVSLVCEGVYAGEAKMQCQSCIRRASIRAGGLTEVDDVLHAHATNGRYDIERLIPKTATSEVVVVAAREG